MRGTRLLASTAVVAAMGGWLTAQSSAPPADTAGVNDFTSVDVHVVDSRTGNAPRGLTEQDFDLRIDGVPTPIRVFSDDPGPLRLSILIDLSHSADVRDSGIAALMSRALDRVLFTSLRPEDRVQMGGLGSRMVLTPFLSDRVELVGAVDQVIRLPEGEEFGPSPLWDQLDEVCRVLSEAPGRRAVLLISDGRATGNRIGLGIIALRLAVADVTVNAIGEASPMIIRQDEKTMVRVSPDSGLKALADATGGLFVPGVLSTLRFGPEVPSFDPAPQIEPIIAHLRSAYVLRFASASHDGNLHTIEVRMKSPDLRATTRNTALRPRRASRHPGETAAKPSDSSYTTSGRFPVSGGSPAGAEHWMPTTKQAPAHGHVFVARQPILDRNKRVVGYELRFKPGPAKAPEPASAIDASARVISDALIAVGLDELTDGRRAFVNVSRQLLLDGIPSVLPAEQVVLELASDIEADGEVLAACETLQSKGYSIAVDDFSLNEWTADLVPFADYLKVDFAVHPDAEARRTMTSPRGGHAPALIAKGIETMDAFESAVSEGYAFFQGFFFGRPLITQARDVPGHQVAHLRLLHALNNPNLSVHQLEDLIKHDASLCYRILRTVNSAAYALRTPIQSIRQALVYLGRDTVRRWVSLWALAGLSERAHAEVVVMSTIRARFCELVSAGRGDDDAGAEGFLLGMCSLLDVILDRPMEAVLAQLPLSAEAQAALRGEDNDGRRLLDCVIAYERGIWDRSVELAKLVGVESIILPKAHADSLRWTRELKTGFGAKDG